MNSEFDYMMMDRLLQDAKYFLGFGNGNEKRLYFLNVKEHIQEMQKLYKSLNPQPKWLTRKKLNKLCKNMLRKEVLV